MQITPIYYLSYAFHHDFLILRPKNRLGSNTRSNFVNQGPNIKRIIMKTILLLKEIYLEGFKNLGNFIVRRYFRLFAWFSIAMFAMVLYAFIFRVSTGFPFQ